MARAKKPRKAAKQNGRVQRTKGTRTDRLVGAKPLDFDLLRGGLPDDRSAEEILADLYAMKYAPKPR